MRLRHQAAILSVALAIVSGCRSTSIAFRTKSGTGESSTNVVRRDRTGIPRAADSELAKTAETVTESLQQVSAEMSDNESVSVAQVSSSTQLAVNADSQTNDTNLKVELQHASTQYSVRTAIETALVQNPDLVALRQAEGVGNAAVGVAQTYPFNPFIQVQATPFQSAPRQDSTNAGSGTTYHYVLLMQQIQLGGQQQFREEAASAALNGIRWNVLQAELLNVAQTERLYFTAVYQQGLRDIAEINAKNNKQLLAILEKQLEDGVATPADVEVVRLDVRSTRQQQRIAEANYQTALLDLKRQLGLAPNVKIDLDASVMRWNWQPATASQLSTMATSRPDVMAARSDAVAARANANLANGSRIPDVQIGPYYQRTDTGITFLGFRGQMDLPVINNGVPLLRQREAEYCQRVMTSQQLATRAQLEAEAAADRYERARLIREEFGDEKQTSVPAALQHLEEQFKDKEVDILRVLQARISLLQSQRADLDALNELMQAAVAVTAASGMPLEMLAMSSNSAVESEKTPQ